MSLPSSSGLVHRHDGHIEGYLNCIAIRHGWTRTFSLSPASVASLDYANLERILELSTLKLRSVRLRIFVENPVDTGLYSKVRPWKDDGSLQSVLVKEFFEGRMREGGILRIEIRDGRQRNGSGWDDDVQGESVETPGSTTAPPTTVGKGKGRSTLDWFARRTGVHATHSEPDTSKSRTRRFFEFVGLAPSGPKSTDTRSHAATGTTRQSNEEENEDHHEDDDEQELLLRKRSAPKRARFEQTSSPFFGSVHPKSVVPLPRERLPRTGNESAPAPPAKDRHIPNGHLEPVQETDFDTDEEIVDTEQEQEKSLQGKTSGNPLNLLLPLLSKVSASNLNSQPKKLKRRPKRPTPKSPPRDEKNHFRGADIVKRPEDAFPPRTGSSTGHPTSSSLRSHSGDLLNGDEDPFRG